MPTTATDFNCQPVNNPKIICQDANSGIYKDIGGDWYLKTGTPLDDFDPNTGAYQENDGTWYTFQGVPLQAYDKTTGSYQETDGTWYYKNGTPYSDDTNKPANPSKSGAKKPSSIMLIVGGVLVIGAIVAIAYATKKK
jgi:hypothetical protein